MHRDKKTYSYLFCIFIIFILAIPFDLSHSQTSYGSRQISDADIQQINSLFKQNGITNGYVTADGNGRVVLIGVYNDENEVDRAFSLAQSVVGVNLVSPVTPESIKVKEWEKCLELILSRQVKGRCGPNTIPVKSIDTNAPGPIENKYALVVGVGTFENGINSLEYASTDALNFYNYLVSPAGGKFNKQDVILLRDQQATKSAIVNSLNTIQAKATENDLVVVYLSSHGTPPDKFGGVYVVTYDSQVNPRYMIWDTSISADILRDFIQGVKAKRLVMIMDACYSNGAYSQVAGFLPSGSKSLGIEEDEGYGRSNEYMSKKLLGAKDIILEDSAPVSTQANSNNTRGWGKVLISASGAGEKSWESENLRSSIFTYYFLEGLKMNDGTIKEAFDYSKPQVYQRVKLEKGPDINQTPQLTPNRSGWDMSLAASE